MPQKFGLEVKAEKQFEKTIRFNEIDFTNNYIQELVGYYYSIKNDDNTNDISLFQ